METDELDVVRCIDEARRPLSTHEVARRLDVSREGALQALMSAHRLGYLVPVETPDHEGRLHWRLTAAGTRFAS